MAELEFTTEELEQEEWRDVVGFEGWYSVSNLGRMRRDKPGKSTYVGRVLIAYPDSYGYPSVGLTRDAKRRSANIHLLVTRSFLGPIPEGQEVNHKDGNKWNNRTFNLEYRTHQGNMEHAGLTGLMINHARGDRNGARMHPERLKRGESHHARLKPETYDNHGPKCKRRLRRDEVLEIRRLAENRLLPRRDIIERFSISKTTLTKILSRTTHADL